MEETIHITNNEQLLHFETPLSNGEFAFVEYRWHNKELVLMHTLVPEGFEGKGIAGALAKYALEYAKANQLKIIVYCPYINAYLKRHTEYQVLLASHE
jgi:predicted GNAT family acetyltransferase